MITKRTGGASFVFFVPISGFLLSQSLLACGTTSPQISLPKDASVDSSSPDATADANPLPYIIGEGGPPYVITEAGLVPINGPEVPGIDSGYYDASPDSTAFEVIDIDAGQTPPDSGALDSGFCNDLVLGGSPILSEVFPAVAPPATGGVIPNGTYYLTSFTFYDPALLPEATAVAVTLTATMQTSDNGATVNFALVSPNGPVVRSTFSQTFNGTAVSVAVTCGGNMQAWSLYSVNTTISPSTVTFFSTSDSIKYAAITFTLQP